VKKLMLALFVVCAVPAMALPMHWKPMEAARGLESARQHADARAGAETRSDRRAGSTEAHQTFKPQKVAPETNKQQ
jgi:hypothetical protein